MLAVDQDGGRSVCLEQRSLRKLAKPGPSLPRLLRDAAGRQAAGIAGPSREFDLARTTGPDVPVDPVLLANRLEAVRNAADRL